METDLPQSAQVCRLAWQPLGPAWLSADRIGRCRVIAGETEALGTIILLVAIPETMVILGFAVAAMVLLIGG
jgi:hypothetical protein